MVEIFDNIRKIYQFSPPCEELADFVEFFSESSAEATHFYFTDTRFTVKMFSSWTPTFWINLGSTYNLVMGNNQYQVPPGTDILIVRDSTVERHNFPADYIFTVKFFPGGLEAIFNIDQSKLIDQVVDLREILPASLLLDVRKTNRYENRIKLMQDFFLGQLQKKKNRDHYIRLVKDTIACYEAGHWQYNVNELSARQFTTSKSINRYFNRVIGTTPKNYFSIVRARTALTAYVLNRKTFVPADFGYYDMSHFYKNIVTFTGEKLTGFKI
jgi:AraC-like DNA-binding protein